uniref:Uncharacterized protein n=1 Tax=Arundo donax TaxID=35708 RepID=A0A0A9GQQ9_ARUDO
MECNTANEMARLSQGENPCQHPMEASCLATVCISSFHNKNNTIVSTVYLHPVKLRIL